MTKFYADTLQDMFLRVEKEELTRDDAAAYHKRSIGSINNYFNAKKSYDNGRHVCAQNISTEAFTQWAVKYGGRGEPLYKADPHPNRKHVKKEPEQQEMKLPEIEPCEKETIEICGLVIEISIKTKGVKQ